MLTVYLLLRSSSWLRVFSSRGIIKKKKPTSRMIARRDSVSGGLISPYPTVLRCGRKKRKDKQRNKKKDDAAKTGGNSVNKSKF